ncbi:DUF6279 family lipoprotein [Paucibacter sp. PLA-PC-4]|uniref:DUF6279 family lipoprotein n=1 Tax=Paucibacter sp. PLA-PC-4 TaxID=2993655 RepID=UPI002248F148|nr:DUF6279 family lipoprotein [Paucibacter sp. PLA-PC-4]MCX2863176.1 DUF6279 family lipoprotein [Paucibacter sp. PLA-PC-4]
MPGWRTLALLLAVLLLQACSTVKLAYNQTPTLLYWRLDSYLDFSDEQAQQVRESLQRLQLRHRREQLPRYAELLQRVQPLLAESISAQQACAVVEQGRSLLGELADPVLHTLLWLAGDLSTEQLKHLERKQGTASIEWKQKWVDISAEQLARLRYEQVLSRSEMLYGSLDEAQKNAIRAGLASAVFDPQRSYAERLRRQQDLLQQLRRIQAELLGPEAARALLQAWLQRVMVSPDPAYQRYQQAQIREGCSTFARLHNATTPAQRTRAQQTLKSYEEDFLQLAAQP